MAKEVSRGLRMGIGLLALAFLGGCSGSKPTTEQKTTGGEQQVTTTPGEKIKLGYVVKMPDEKWFQDEWKFAQQCADKYQFELIKIGATDGEKVLAAIDNLAANGAKGFVIVTPDVKLGPAIMAKAESHNLKVFSGDDQFVGADGKFMDVPYMGISASQIGELVGKALAEEYKKRGWKPEDTAVCAVTFDELNTTKERTDGSKKALVAAGFPAGQIYEAPEKTTDVPGAMNATDVLLTQHPNFKHWMVYSVNDEGVLGAVRSLENRGFKADAILGIGIGGSSCFEELAKQPPTGFWGTCLISPKRHGYESTEMLYKWVKEGIVPPKDTRTSGIIVHRGNYKQIAKEQGLME